MAETQQTHILAYGTSIATAKQEMEARLSAIEPNLANAVRSGAVHTVDFEMYTNRHLKSDTTIDLMQSSDTKKVGITNVNNRKLEANTYALVTGIQLLSTPKLGENETLADSDDAVSTAAYGQISQPEIINGEFELKSGDKVLVPRTSCQAFVNPNSDRPGYVKLQCPKLLPPLTDITPTLYLSKALTNTAVKLVLCGIKTNKA